LGTGRFGSQYIVGSKSIGDKVSLTASLGWGAMGQQSGFPLSAVSRLFRHRPAYVDRDLPKKAAATVMAARYP
jgi:hypothetical protein